MERYVVLERDHQAVLFFYRFELSRVDGFGFIFIGLVFDILQGRMFLRLFLIFFGLLVFQLFGEFVQHLGPGNILHFSKLIKVIDIQDPFGEEFMESPKIKYTDSVLD